MAPESEEADVCGKVCDHGSPCLLLEGHEPGDRHETQHGCVFLDRRERDEAMREAEIVDNESVYDGLIAPLMGQIIAICKAHGIPMFATFQYGPESDEQGIPLCTTSIPVDGQAEVFRSLARVAMDGWIPTQPFMAFTVSTRKP